MTVLTLLLSVLIHAAPADTLAGAGDGGGPTIVTATPTLAPRADTTPASRRPQAIEVSDAYETRLRIHRYASYTLIPLFAAQSIAGNQMYQSGGPTPGWAKSMHSIGAGG